MILDEAEENETVKRPSPPCEIFVFFRFFVFLFLCAVKVTRWSAVPQSKQQKHVRTQPQPPWFLNPAREKEKKNENAEKKTHNEL